jgi:tetratricopeptide (TPR) repeat protein
VALFQGEHGRAAALYEEALGLSRALGDTRGSAVWLDSLGMVVSQQGEHERAAALYEEALGLFRALGDRRGSANALGNLGRVVLSQGDYGRAAALLEEALLLSRDIGTWELVAAGVESLAWVAASCGQARQAARLCGAAEAQREALGAPLPPDERAGHDQAVAAMRAALGEQAFAAAWAAGRALPLEQAIGEALAIA